MLQRLRDSGLNLLVLLISLLVFLGAFCGLSYFAASQRPVQITVLAAARDLAMGQVIGPGDLVEKRVYQDENAALYIPAEEKAGVAGGVAALPVGAGQPLFRDAVLAPAGQGVRLSAALADYPGYSLFPLPLSAQNVIAPEASSFLPGDLVGITVVIASRPQAPATPGPPAGLAFLSLTPEVSATPTPETQPGHAVERGFPPLAKDLFPGGVRVIAVQGLPVDTVQDATAGSAFTAAAAAPAIIDLAQGRTLILLVPDGAREALALALEQGDRLIVSMLSAGEPSASTGFTYWDFEERFHADREQRLATTLTPPTAAPTRRPSPTALPAGSPGTPER
ncbi:MAG: SAF domain-containing protein [Anaerolineales bacterium]